MSDERKSLIDAFTEAAKTFRHLAHRYHGSDSVLRDRLMDAANEMFLARDACGEKMPKSGAEWAAICFEVEDAQDFLRENDIHMNFAPVTTSTGTKTYRIITPPRM